MTPTSIIKRQEKSLRALALFLTHDEDDSQDLFQETCLRIVRFIHTFEAGTNESAWVKMILRNCFKDDYRRKRRIPEHVGYETIRETYPIEQDDQLLSDELTEALDDIGQEKRLIFMLTHIEDYTYEELSAMMCLPKATIRNRLHSAKNLMRERLMAQ